MREIDCSNSPAGGTVNDILESGAAVRVPWQVMGCGWGWTHLPTAKFRNIEKWWWHTKGTWATVSGTEGALLVRKKTVLKAPVQDMLYWCLNWCPKECVIAPQLESMRMFKAAKDQALFYLSVILAIPLGTHTHRHTQLDKVYQPAMLRKKVIPCILL